MNKEQFLAMSLPFKVKVIFTDEYGVDRIHEMDHYLYQYMCDSQKDDTLYKFKPILHPLSDLTKPIERKGEKFVPSIILFPTDEFEEDLGMPTHYDYAKTFISEPESRCLDIFYWLKLIEWHFDIAGLIEKGEAIDVNTLPENPYK